MKHINFELYVKAILYDQSLSFVPALCNTKARRAYHFCFLHLQKQYALFSNTEYLVDLKDKELSIDIYKYRNDTLLIS